MARRNPTLPCFLDFEASSLRPRSYPIEVAWSLGDGSVESHLIDPRPVPEWTDWDPVAETEIHHITPAQLHREGRTPIWVAGRMNSVLQGLRLHTDAPDWDGFWLQVLFQAAGMEPAFTLAAAQALWFTELAGGPDSERRLNELDQQARARVAGPRHRAANDVRHFIELYRLCRKE